MKRYGDAVVIAIDQIYKTFLQNDTPAQKTIAVLTKIANANLNKKQEEDVPQNNDA